MVYQVIYGDWSSKGYPDVALHSPLPCNQVYSSSDLEPEGVIFAMKQGMEIRE